MYTTFVAYATIAFTGVLVAYAFLGSVVWIGTVSIPTAGIVGALMIVGLLVLASN